MNNDTVISTVSHGKLNRDPRQAQPLATVSSTVLSGKLNRRPTVTSTVVHGSAYRSLSYSLSLNFFQGSSRTQWRTTVSLTATQASKRLTPPTSGRLSVVEAEAKTEPAGVRS